MILFLAVLHREGCTCICLHIFACTLMHHRYKYVFPGPHHLWTFLGQDISAGGSVGNGCGLFCRWGSSSGGGRSRRRCSADYVWRNPGYMSAENTGFRYPSSIDYMMFLSKWIRLWFSHIESHLTSLTCNDAIVDSWWFVSADFAWYNFDLGCKKKSENKKDLHY